MIYIIKALYLLIYNKDSSLTFARALWKIKLTRMVNLFGLSYFMTQGSSQEVVGCPSVDISEIILLWCRIELEEGIFHELIDFHDSRLVTASVAVVWRREHCYHVPVVRPVVAVHHQLVGTGDEFQVVGVVELFRDVLSE